MFRYRVALVAALFVSITPATLVGQEIYVTIGTPAPEFSDGRADTCGLESRQSLPSWFGEVASVRRWFRATGFSVGAQMANSASLSTSGDRKKPDLLPIRLTKPVDDCSLLLLRFLTRAAITSGAIYTLGQTSEREPPTPQLLVRFATAAVGSTEITQKDGVLSESIVLHVGQISYTFQGTDANGRPLTPICVGWDLITNSNWDEGCRL